MYNEKMTALGETRSVIRELFEYGNRLKEQIGRENVFDFTLGNPSVPTPHAVNEAAIRLLKNEPAVHAYTSAQGAISVREKIAKFHREKYELPISAERIYMTCGAAAGLAVALKSAISEDQNEVIVFAPFFPEYRVFIENAGGKTVVVPVNEKDFQIDFNALISALSERTAAVIVNSPNNPSGIVYTKETLIRLSDILRQAENRYENTIVLLSDEPYREIAFDCVPESPLSHYDDAVLCYSFSKSFSLPGERIGFLAVSDRLKEADRFYLAVLGAGRSLGYVCAPSLMQYVVAECLSEPSDVAVYLENRDVMSEALTTFGYTVIKPQGAFYLLLKAPDGNAARFSDFAKEYGVLVVPTDSFALPGYVRIATCVTKETILRSLPLFKEIAEKY